MKRRTVSFAALLLALLVLLVGCGENIPVGPESVRDDILYYAPETPAGETVEGIVSHSVSDLDDFLSWVELPVLILISTEHTLLDREATLLLEELAYAYRSGYACLRVDADAYPEVATLCNVGELPGYAVIRDGNLVTTTGTLTDVDRYAVTEILNLT